MKRNLGKEGKGRGVARVWLRDFLLLLLRLHRIATSVLGNFYRTIIPLLPSLPSLAPVVSALSLLSNCLTPL
ncbi:hypothetical protein B0I37DRAFT_98070 [Chaetomium sp. MPI-CAGE-AT-0009]|nr:hypothetical protein B0I37DRAFT_98070 [Chaetomium sp. MPI-CAGE-AT-0009]